MRLIERALTAAIILQLVVFAALGAMNLNAQDTDPSQQQFVEQAGLCA
jgi:hypothetical protein